MFDFALWQLVGILNYSLRVADNSNNSLKVLIQAQVKEKKKKLFSIQQEKLSDSRSVLIMESEAENCLC